MKRSSDPTNSIFDRAAGRRVPGAAAVKIFVLVAVVLFLSADLGANETLCRTIWS
jgi:hypothetical protein